jgi:CRP/FNR family transcriptional regulator, dissimilatory nitrate respiration regulator
MELLTALLRTHPVFASLDETVRIQLVKLAVRRELKKGERLAMQGDVWEYLFLVAKGELDAVKVSGEGRNLLVTTFGIQELFWGLAFFQDQAPLLVTLEAPCPTLVYLWSRQDTKALFIEHGRMSWELCLLMIQRMQRASAILEEMAFQPVAGRLARLLLDQYKSAGDGAIARQLTLDEMAARIGTTREMVCRVLYRFADKNLIDVKRTEFLLTDKAGLGRIAEGS